MKRRRRIETHDDDAVTITAVGKTNSLLFPPNGFGLILQTPVKKKRGESPPRLDKRTAGWRLLLAERVAYLSGAGCLRAVADDVRYCDDCKPVTTMDDGIREHTLSDGIGYASVRFGPLAEIAGLGSEGTTDVPAAWTCRVGTW